PLIVRPALWELGHLKAGSATFNLWLGLMLFIPSALAGVVALFGGYLIDLWGRRQGLVWGILVDGVAAVAGAACTSIHQLLVIRCITLMAVYVEYLAGIAWVAELFEDPQQRERALSYTQACFNLGGLLVTAVYFLAVTHAERLPAIHGMHSAWRYTILSG